MAAFRHPHNDLHFQEIEKNVWALELIFGVHLLL
jgi:hypothetical protein